MADEVKAVILPLSGDSGRLLSDAEIDSALSEYGTNIERINEEFKQLTRLQGFDIPMIFLAVALQVLRWKVIEELTRVEKSGQKNRNERVLHNAQDEILKPFRDDNESSVRSDAFYCPSAREIALTRGVPYDTTRYGEEMKYAKLFKGGNHRFSTLGHDPIAGLVFGTGNIMTDTITTAGKARGKVLPSRLPGTYRVHYDASRANPVIGFPVLTPAMFATCAKRIAEGKPGIEAACAALVKQIIHIGTDLYTPCGIQLPLSMLLLDTKATEKLAEYISMGDALRVGAQAGLSVLINALVSMLHGLTMMGSEEGGDFVDEIHQARTRKVISISNVIVSSSSIVETLMKKELSKLDIGGIAVTCYRLITDTAFITRLKYEYINTEMGKIYDARGAGLLLPEDVEKEMRLFGFESS